MLDASLAYAHDQHDGYTYDPTLHRDVNDQNINGARGKLLAKIGPKFTAVLTLDGTVDHFGADFYTPKRPIIGGTLKTPIYGAFDAADSYASQGPKNDSWSAGVSLKLSYALDPHITLNSITAVRGFAQDLVNYNNDGQPLVAYSPADPALVSISDNAVVYREHDHPGVPSARQVLTFRFRDGHLVLLSQKAATELAEDFSKADRLVGQLRDA